MPFRFAHYPAFACVVFVALLATLCPPARAAGPAGGVEFFEKRIRPVLVERCYECHSAGAKKLKGGLLLDTREGLLRGGDNGPALVPGEPDRSAIIKAVRYHDPDVQMPPKQKLADAQIADLEAWVRMGAPDPRGGAVAATTQPAGIDFEAARKQWAFQPPQAQAVPEVKAKEWVRSPIDAFILARLEEKGLQPAPPADKRTLIRRATYDLTGLPPTVAEVEAFVADDSPEAFAKVVDRLLASPQYGERWARHWLDVVRYTDFFDARSLGGDAGADIPFSWRYRDWVVQSLNRDLPYDQFVMQQIAGDLLPAKEPGKTINTDGVIATGVYVIGEWGTGDADKEKMLTDIVDDQVDVTGRAFLGLTLACARCHDHKFDPIPTRDYYSVAGIFFNSHILPSPGVKTSGSPVLRIPLVDPKTLEERKRLNGEIAKLQKKIEAARDEHLAGVAKDLVPRMDEYLVAAWQYANRPAGEAGVKLDAFAARRGLNRHALARLAALLSPPKVKPLGEPVRDVGGNPGLSGWKNPGPSGTPAALANSTDKPIRQTTLTVPPHSVTVHPSPTSGTAVAWKSPFSGSVHVSGRVADADPNCGDGVEWRVALRTTRGTRDLAAGSLPNGAAAPFSGALESVEVQAGQVIEVVVLPKAEYTCDTTVVELRITERGTGRVWDLGADVSPDFVSGGKGNPHPDRYGNADAWTFYEWTGSSSGLVVPDGSSLARWLGAAAGGAGAEDVKESAQAVRAALTAAAPAAADSQLLAALTDVRSPLWSEARKDDAPVARLRRELDAMKKKAAEAVPVAHGLQEGGVPQSAWAGFRDAPVLIRGRYDRPGEIAPRGFPRILARDEQQPKIPPGSSGRLELARWVASKNNPLTARVMVNRIWQHHFGEGIVRTPNNFGKLGSPPTHPQLLDHLAVKFVKTGWSIKSMHRSMMLSGAYQQSSTPRDGMLEADPDNLLLGRMPRRRLDAESLRDAMLAVTDRLDVSSIGGPAVVELDSPRRTLYLRTVRSDRSNYRALFDAADPQSVTEKRIESTVAPQSLFLLNSPFATGTAAALAEQVAKEPGDDRARIGWLYRRLYSRPPEEVETEISLAALKQLRAGNADDAWPQYCQVLLSANEFVYVD